MSKPINDKAMHRTIVICSGNNKNCHVEVAKKHKIKNIKKKATLVHTDSAIILIDAT